MCGIVGFTGEHQAAPILLDGLSKLEYRGYDSPGIAVRADAERRNFRCDPIQLRGESVFQRHCGGGHRQSESDRQRQRSGRIPGNTGIFRSENRQGCPPQPGGFRPAAAAERPHRLRRQRRSGGNPAGIYPG